MEEGIAFLDILRDSNGILYYELLESEQNITAQCYIVQSTYLNDSIKQFFPEKRHPPVIFVP